MKKILIVGSNSYIGCSFEKWMKNQKSSWEIQFVSSRNYAWKQLDFGQYHCVLHVAGIAHVDPSADMEQEYYKINRDLAVDCCQKAQREGAGQFVFLSSIIVYGESKSLTPKIITRDTYPDPNGFYGKSKWEAEQGIMQLANANFKVAIVRPPMVYGKGSKGNYPKLAKLAKIVPVFPDLENQRSMIHIDHLCECLRLIIQQNAEGVFCPQNREYVNTAELVKTIADTKGKAVWTTKLANPFIRLLSRRIPKLNKLFGTLIYDLDSWSCFNNAYQVWSFRETIEKTEQ